MAEQSGFFNSNVVNGEYDRVYLAEHFAKYFASFIGNGVFGGKSNELMVTQSMSPGMRIEVLSGMAWINGFWYENTSNLSLDISVADGVLNRIDAIVVKLGKIERNIWIEVVRGAPATNAVAPTIQRNSDYHELKLAEVHIKAGATSITQADIVDTRLNSEVCGFVTGVVQQFDTTEFGKQLDGYISEYAAEYKAFLDELEISGTKELDSLITRLNALVVDSNALASLGLEVDNVASETALTSQTLGYSKKNLIPYPYVHTSRVANGITWTDNGDGTVTANGKATAGSYFNLYTGKPFAPGKYIISSNADEKNKYYIYASFTNKTTGENYTVGLGYDNTGFEITESDVEQNNIYLNLYIVSGTTASNVLLKPMLRRAEILDGTWEPYKRSVAEIVQEDEIERGCFYRYGSDGVKEWINPPCEPGWEYPLAERWDNKRVYQMTLYAASLPVNSVMSIATNSEWDKVVSVSGYAHDADDLTYYPFPVILHNQVTPIAVISRVESDGYIVITTNGDASYLRAYITIKYTKN